MANYSVTTKMFNDQPEAALAAVEAYLDTLDSTTEVLLAPPTAVGGVGFVTIFVVHKTAP